MPSYVLTKFFDPPKTVEMNDRYPFAAASDQDAIDEAHHLVELEAAGECWFTITLNGSEIYDTRNQSRSPRPR